MCEDQWKRARRIWRLCAVVAIVTFGLSSCGSVEIKRDDRQIVGYAYTEGHAKQTAIRNQKLLRQYSGEQEYYLSGHALPQLCVALSGGGTRSASFSIGILQALEGEALLGTADIISGVSGGAYALSWYYAQNVLAQSTLSGPKSTVADLFEIGGAYQNYLESHAALVTGPSAIGPVTINLALIPWNLLVNGVFGFHWNTGIGHQYYQHRLRQTFQTAPDGASRAIEFHELPAFIKGRLPYFIIGATALIDDDPNHLGSTLSKTIFELTPVRFGADAFGYSDDADIVGKPREVPKYPFSFAGAVAVSGAALDTAAKVPGGSQKMFASIGNVDLGIYIDNYRAIELSPWRYLPFPWYFFFDYQRDASGKKIYLTDGGYTDNLATFVLVRRLCKHIIVVDAEHDPYFRFEAYEKLQKALRAEMGVALTIPEIDNRLQMLIGRPRGLRIESDEAAAAKFGQTPIVQGNIGYFEVATQERTTIDVTYVKLSIDKSKIESMEYPKTVRDYYNAQAQKDLYGRFPQEPTTDQSFSPEQFRAYRDLGCFAVTRHLSTGGKLASMRGADRRTFCQKE